MVEYSLHDLPDDIWTTILIEWNSCVAALGALDIAHSTKVLRHKYTAWLNSLFDIGKHKYKVRRETIDSFLLWCKKRGVTPSVISYEVAVEANEDLIRAEPNIFLHLKKLKVTKKNYVRTDDDRDKLAVNLASIPQAILAATSLKTLTLYRLHLPDAQDFLQIILKCSALQYFSMIECSNSSFREIYNVIFALPQLKTFMYDTCTSGMSGSSFRGITTYEGKRKEGKNHSVKTISIIQRFVAEYLIADLLNGCPSVEVLEIGHINVAGSLLLKRRFITSNLEHLLICSLYKCRGVSSKVIYKLNEVCGHTLQELTILSCSADGSEPEVNFDLEHNLHWSRLYFDEDEETREARVQQYIAAVNNSIIAIGVCFPKLRKFRYSFAAHRRDIISDEAFTALIRSPWHDQLEEGHFPAISRPENEVTVPWFYGQFAALTGLKIDGREIFGKCHFLAELPRAHAIKALRLYSWDARHLGGELCLSRFTSLQKLRLHDSSVTDQEIEAMLSLPSLVILRFISDFHNHRVMYHKDAVSKPPFDFLVPSEDPAAAIVRYPSPLREWDMGQMNTMFFATDAKLRTLLQRCSSLVKVCLSGEAKQNQDLHSRMKEEVKYRLDVFQCK